MLIFAAAPVFSFTWTSLFLRHTCTSVFLDQTSQGVRTHSQTHTHTCTEKCTNNHTHTPTPTSTHTNTHPSTHTHTNTHPSTRTHSKSSTFALTHIRLLHFPLFLLHLTKSITLISFLNQDPFFASEPPLNFIHHFWASHFFSSASKFRKPSKMHFVFRFVSVFSSFGSNKKMIFGAELSNQSNEVQMEMFNRTNTTN